VSEKSEEASWSERIIITGCHHTTPHQQQQQEEEEEEEAGPVELSPAPPAFDGCVLLEGYQACCCCCQVVSASEVLVAVQLPTQLPAIGAQHVQSTAHRMWRTQR